MFLSVLAVAVLMATAAWMGAGDRRVLDRGRHSGSPAAAGPIRSGAGIDSRWWNAHWPYRLPVSVGAAGYARENGTPVDVELDFADRLGQVDASGECFSVEPYTQQNKWTGDLPARLTVGVAEDNTFTHVRAIVRSATRPLNLVVGAPRARPDGAPSRGGSN